MKNLYEVIKESLHFNQLVLGETICIEYTCPLEEEHLGIYTQHDYIIHVLSGKKAWKTIHGDWTVEAGETLFVKKGAAIVTQYFDDDFCMLGFFLPDDVIRASLKDIAWKIPSPLNDQSLQFTVHKLEKSSFLDGFFQSMLVYFRTSDQPPDPIVKLKLEELLINLVHQASNPDLVGYLKFLAENRFPSLPHIMEANYCYNLRLEEFARMTHRSLSSFKRDFLNHYGMSPGKWLLAKRLDLAANFLLRGDANITQIAFDTGFQDVSHFGRAFKRKFGTSPTSYRKAAITTE